MVDLKQGYSLVNDMNCIKNDRIVALVAIHEAVMNETKRQGDNEISEMAAPIAQAVLRRESVKRGHEMIAKLQLELFEDAGNS